MSIGFFEISFSLSEGFLENDNNKDGTDFDFDVNDNIFCFCFSILFWEDIF